MPRPKTILMNIIQLFRGKNRSEETAPAAAAAPITAAEEAVTFPMQEQLPKKEKEISIVEEPPEEAAPAEESEENMEEEIKAIDPEEEIAEDEELVAVVEDGEEPEAETVSPRRSVAFIASECYPFVKTGGLGDVMYALPKALLEQNCDVRVLIPNYKCIPQKYKDKMVYRGSFDMDLCSDGRRFFVGIMEYIWDGITYDFIENEEFFSLGRPYTTIVDDIPKYCFFSKAALAALNYLDWIPDIIHCHDWQAGLIPVYLKTLFRETPVGRAKSIFTIHNLRFQGIYNKGTIEYWSGLPDYVFGFDGVGQGSNDANMLKGGISFADVVSTVSETYAEEIKTQQYGENLDSHLRYHQEKLGGIVNGIDIDIWNPENDTLLPVPYSIGNVLENKKLNKKALQEALGLEQDDGKLVLGLVSRLTDQKGLDLVNTIIPAVMDGNTQFVVLGTGDAGYEDSFRYYASEYPGAFSANILYNEPLAHKIYAGVDALLVPSQFEPCGLTQLISMRYGTIPIVRETGGLKDTVQPYTDGDNSGNGFTFDVYDASLLLQAINNAKSLYFNNRWCWDEMVLRDMDKDVSWAGSALKYKELYLSLTQW